MFDRRLIACVPVLALLVLGPARGQNVQIQIQGNAQQVQIVPAFGGGALLTPQALEQLKLTAEQKEKFAKIESEYKDKQKAASDKLRQAYQDKDRQAIQTASAEQAKARTDALAQLQSLLSDEQKKTLEQVQRRPLARPFAPGVGGGQVLPPAIQNRLKLTDEQKKKVEEIQKELEAKILGVLTEEQRKQYEEMKKATSIRPAIQLRLQ